MKAIENLQVTLTKKEKENIESHSQKLRLCQNIGTLNKDEQSQLYELGEYDFYKNTQMAEFNQRDDRNEEQKMERTNADNYF